MFSFGANSKSKPNNFNYKIKCNDLKNVIKYSMWRHNFKIEQSLKTDNTRAQLIFDEVSNKALDKAFKFSTIYNTFCKK